MHEWLTERAEYDNSGVTMAAELIGQLTIHNPPATGTLGETDNPSKGSGLILGPKTHHRYDLRSRTGGEAIQMPLITKGGARDVYQPFSFTDMGYILDKMPNPTEGEGAWMSKFCQLTMGQKLAMGDWRAIIGNQLGKHEITESENAAQTATLTDCSPFLPNSTNIGRAMRERFPVPQGAFYNLSFSPKSGEAILEYLLRCKDT